MGTAVLGVLGYDVLNIRHGMASWTCDPEVYVRRFDPATTPGNFETESEANTGGHYAYPVLENTTSSDDDAILLAAAKTVAPKFISAADLNMKIAEDEEMTIVSVRQPAVYAIGHIPGAINLPYGTAITDGLDQINPDAPVYVYCYTGHTAGQTVALLNMLGYDAYSVSYGMCGWSSDPDVTAGACFDPASCAGYETNRNGYPVCPPFDGQTGYDYT
jgi:rhodanese-related sulfurtransferase